MWALNVARDALRVAERGAEAVLKGTQWFTRESARFALETAKKVRGRGRGKRCYLGCCASGEGVCMRASVHACVRAVACMICMQSQACMHWHANARMFKPTRAHTWHGPQVSDGVLKGTEAAAIETANGILEACKKTADGVLTGSEATALGAANAGLDIARAGVTAAEGIVGETLGAISSALGATGNALSSVKTAGFFKVRSGYWSTQWVVSQCTVRAVCT